MKNLFIATVIGLALATAAYAQSTSPQPRVTTITSVGAAGTQIVSTNPSRRSVRICNTGASVAVWIWASQTNCTTIVSSFVLAPVTSNVITCYTPPATASSTNAGSLYCAAGATTVSAEEWN